MRLVLGIAAGAGITAYVIYKHPDFIDKIVEKVKHFKPGNSVKVGEESSELLLFQSNLNKLHPELNLKENGIYSEEMKRKINSHLATASEVYNTEGGEIDNYFLENFNFVAGQNFELENLKPPTENKETKRTIEKGDKSKDVERLQKLLRWLAEMPELAEGNLGAYTKETAEVASIVFRNTTVLTDPLTGRIDADFINSMYLIVNE